MKGVINVIVAVLLCAVQTTIFAKITFFGTAPNLLLAFAVCVALSRGGVEGGATGLLCGILTDVMGYGRFGANALFYMYIAVGIGLVSRRIYRAGSLVAFMFCLAVTFTYGFLYFFFALFIWKGGSLWFAVWHGLIPESLYTALAAALLMKLVRYLNKRFAPREA